MKLRKFRSIVCCVFILALSGCATVYQISQKIPGIDRIFHQSSKAEVGPVKTHSGEIIAGTESPAPEETDASQSDATTQPPTLSTDETQAAPVTPPEAVVASPEPRGITHHLHGKVKVLAKTGEISPQGVMVRIKRTDGQTLRSPVSHKQHVMDMSDKIYAPGQMVIRKGDSINFTNSDPVKHNVFSSSGANAFDLGTFAGGLQREVTLNEEGIVQVYCNIHPKMAAFVAVDDIGLTVHANPEDGSYAFSDLPSGEYELTLWSIRGEQKHLVELSELPHRTLDLTFDTSAYQPKEHPNKFGKAYRSSTVANEYF